MVEDFKKVESELKYEKEDTKIAKENVEKKLRKDPIERRLLGIAFWQESLLDVGRPNSGRPTSELTPSSGQPPEEYLPAGAFGSGVSGEDTSPYSPLFIPIASVVLISAGAGSVYFIRRKKAVPSSEIGADFEILDE